MHRYIIDQLAANDGYVQWQYYLSCQRFWSPQHHDGIPLESPVNGNIDHQAENPQETMAVHLKCIECFLQMFP